MRGKNIVVLVGVCCFFCYHINAQYQSANWYFGNHAGVTFLSGSPVALTDGMLSTLEGCATISDELGNLLFYTDGITVYDRQHNMMPNGFGLHGDPSSTQSGLIVPFPGNPNQYYIFTTRSYGNVNLGFKYTVVDMSLNGGMGDVIPTQKNIPLLSRCSEKITAVKHPDGSSYWVLTFANFNGNTNQYNTIYAYKITSTGIENPIRTQIPTSTTDARGYMKVSPNGEKLAQCNQTQRTVQLMDFDATEGTVSNFMEDDLDYNGANLPGYGVEFSPDNSKLYIATGEFAMGTVTLIQYNLSTFDIFSSAQTLHVEQGHRGALQLALDGKIYRARKGRFYLGVINNPNSLGAAADYVHDGVDLAGRVCEEGLPPFIQSIFNATILAQNTCFGNVTQLSVNATGGTPLSYLWNFGDPASGTNNSSTLAQPTHVFTQPGTYNVTVAVTFVGGQVRNFNQQITIAAPPVVQNTTLSVCSNNSPASFNLSLANVSSEGNIVKSYFGNLANAISNQNPISNPYVSNGNETVYVRVTHPSTGCYSIAQVNLQILPSPIAPALVNHAVCDSDGNGSELIHLPSFNTLFSNQPDYIFSYFNSLENAQNNTQPLSNSVNLTSSEATFYVRISLNSCFIVSELRLSLQTIQSQSISRAVCDDDINGEYTVQLSNFSTQISSTAGISITYHETLIDAQNQSNSIPAMNNYIITSFPKTLYVRISLGTCFKIETLTFTTFPLQNYPPYTWEVCDDNQDGYFTFNLNEIPTLLNLSPSNFTFQYFTQLTNAQSNTSPISNHQFSTNGATIYLRLSSPQICPEIIPITLVVKAKPQLQLQSQYFICPSTTALLDAGEGFSSYLWSTGAITQSIQAGVGNYSVTVTNSLGCSDAANVQVLGIMTPIITQIVVNGNYITVLSQQQSSVEYSIDGVNWQGNPTFGPLESGIYTVQIRTTDNTCEGEPKQVAVFSIPNAFSPDGDGINDSWKIRGLEVYPNVEIQIFDRFGKLIHQKKNLTDTFSWDGKYLGNPLPSGTYWYIIWLNEELKLTGFVVLKNRDTEF